MKKSTKKKIGIGAGIVAGLFVASKVLGKETPESLAQKYPGIKRILTQQIAHNKKTNAPVDRFVHHLNWSKNPANHSRDPQRAAYSAAIKFNEATAQEHAKILGLI